MGSKGTIQGPGGRTTDAAIKFERLLKENDYFAAIEYLWNTSKDGPILEGKKLIELVRENKQISRMWETAVGTDTRIALLMDPKTLKDLRDKTDKAPNGKAAKAAKDNYDAAVKDRAAAAIKAMLPQAGQLQHVKWIGKRGEKKGGWDTLLFSWARSTKGFPFPDKFEMTISPPDQRNQYRVEIIIKGKSFSSFSLLSVERSPTSVPRSNEHCFAAFTFGNQNVDVTKQIIVYIRFAGPTMLVGKAFKANWATKSEYENLWGDLVLAKY